MYNWVTGGHSPAVELEQLQEWGYAMAIIPGLLIGTVGAGDDPGARQGRRADARCPTTCAARPPCSTPSALTDWLAAADRFAHD